MDVDQEAPADDDEVKSEEDLEGRETPQPLEEETESEAEASVEESSALQSQTTRPRLEEPAEPPPRRDLPFSRRAAPSAKAVEPSKGEDDDGGETDDDEL